MATGTNPFIPVGTFSQAGIVNLVVYSEPAKILFGTWFASLAQNDSSGYTPSVVFGGTFEVDRATCSGNFHVRTPVQIAQPGFHAVFVADGDEV